MNINELNEIVKIKLEKEIKIEDLLREDKSFLHKDHKTNQPGKFHIKLTIKSKVLRNLSKIESNKIIYKVLNDEIKNFIHSIQILII